MTEPGREFAAPCDSSVPAGRPRWRPGPARPGRVPTGACTVSCAVTPVARHTAEQTSADLVDAVRAVWADALETDLAPVPADASFLSLGGHSVLAVRMAAMLRKRLGTPLALADVRVEQSAAQLAALVHERSTGSGTGALRPLPLDLRRREDPAAIGAGRRRWSPASRREARTWAP